MKIITFTDSNYLAIFNIFYDNFKIFDLDLLVVCLDEESFTNLNDRGINTMYKPYDIKNKNKFWEFRLNIINEIFKENKTDIIHTDADCFWFKNIVECINVKNELDIMGSIAFGHPKDIVNKLGFVLCCGFYFIKYTEKNSVILDNIINQPIHHLDDQVRFNYYMFNNLKSIENNDSFLYKTITLNDETKIGIISDSIISRRYNKNLYCFHPYLSSNSIPEKLLQLKSTF
jgi:hypothetical protein